MKRQAEEIIIIDDSDDDVDDDHIPNDEDAQIAMAIAMSKESHALEQKTGSLAPGTFDGHSRIDISRVFCNVLQLTSRLLSASQCHPTSLQRLQTHSIPCLRAELRWKELDWNDCGYVN